MRTDAYSSLPKIAGLLCIAWAALAGCGDDDPTGTTTNGAGGAGGAGASTSASSAGSDGGGPTDPGTGASGGGDGGGGAGAGAGPGSGAGGNPSSDTVRFIGRFDKTAPGGPRFSWPGSAIATRFSGTSISVRFNEEPVDAGHTDFFEVVIDGESTGVLEVTEQQDLYTVVEDLPDGEHDLLLHRRTEGFAGITQFVEFIPEEGEQLLPVAPAPDRRIEVIGDSISAGYGIDGPDAMCPFSAETENNYLAYSALTARLLEADATIVAWSGKGVYRNYEGQAGETMPELYSRTLASEPQPAWDFSSWVPQVVVINLGTNDFSPNVGGAEFNAPFKTAYAGLVETVRTKYPEAYIFCAIGPMLSDDYPAGAQALTRARTLVNEVVDERTDDGDTRVRFIEFPPQNGDANGLGCDYHPSVKTNELMATQLAAAIKEELDW